MANIILEDKSLRAEFDPSNGALVGLLNKATGWRAIGRPELGISFRAMAPMDGRRNNQIDGLRQSPPEVKVSEGGRRVEFHWPRLKSEHGGELDISFRATVTLEPFRESHVARPPSGVLGLENAQPRAAVPPTASTLLFEGRVENRSQLTLENVSYPCVGDLSVPSADEPLKRMSLGYCGMNASALLPRFDGDSGYFGFDYPLQMLGFPAAPFVLCASDKQGLYAGCHDASAKEAITFAWQLKPGFETAFSEASGMAAASGLIDGRPNHLEMMVWHFPFVAPGEMRDLSPIALGPYAGTWHKGADVYKAWRKTWFTPPPKPAWAKDVHSWQQIHINSPEDELRCRYADLPKYGRDCAKRGVKAIQLVGWNNGGQDRGNPSHDTDDRLGSRQELKAAIAEIQAMGVQVVLFSKFIWADRSQDWFREELVRFASRDFFGDYHVYGGYRYQTPTQLADLSTRRLVPMCQPCAEWRRIAGREFAKLLALGAAGTLHDESSHHGGAIYCFDPAHGHRVPTHIYAGDADLAEGFRRLADEARPGEEPFLMGGEACYDIQSMYYSLSYSRIGLAGPIHIPGQRYIDPRANLMIAVTAFNDRTTINQCLLYRYVISYEPFNFKGRLDDFPRTMEYGKAVDDLRRKFRHFLWEGEFQGTLGATVQAGGKTIPPSAHAPEAAYSVFLDAKTGKRAVVVVNLDLAKELAISVELAGRQADLKSQISSLPSGLSLRVEDKSEISSLKLLIVSPENTEPRPTDGRFCLPPDSAAVVMEG